MTSNLNFVTLVNSFCYAMCNFFLALHVLNTCEVKIKYYSIPLNEVLFFQFTYHRQSLGLHINEFHLDIWKLPLAWLCSPELIHASICRCVRKSASRLMGRTPHLLFSSVHVHIWKDIHPINAVVAGTLSGNYSR